MFRQGLFGNLDPSLMQPRLPRRPEPFYGRDMFTGVSKPGTPMGPVQPGNAIDPALPSNLPPGNPYPNPVAPPQTPPPNVGPMQEGQYDWGRAGDGSQTALMAPGVQAWINQMLFGPGMNTGWRNGFTPDPNNLLASIQQASGQMYSPGPSAMTQGPARGY